MGVISRKLSRERWAEKIIEAEGDLCRAEGHRPRCAADCAALADYVAWLKHKRLSAEPEKE